MQQGAEGVARQDRKEHRLQKGGAADGLQSDLSALKRHQATEQLGRQGG